MSYTPEEIGDTAPASPPPTVDQPTPLARPEAGECAVEGAEDLVETLRTAPEPVQRNFRSWRESKKFPQYPSSPEMLAEWRAELAKIQGEHRRDNAPYEPPVGSPID